ncbi:MAG TPA: hypothetical protein VFI73_06825 [Candidatus Nitrosopolaris sp.]|nr:hypothetical protein [Candidatus Nitrosopolaris sp.]
MTEELGRWCKKKKMLEIDIKGLDQDQAIKTRWFQLKTKMMNQQFEVV